MMNRVLGLSAFLISLSILILAGSFFAHFIHENIGSTVVLFAFFSWIAVSFALIFEMQNINLNE